MSKDSHDNEAPFVNDFIDEGLLRKQIIAYARDGVIVYDSDMRFRVWNPFMEMISGKPACDVLGKRPYEEFPFLVDSGVVESHKKAMAGEMPETVEFPYHVPETGKSGWVSNTSSPLRNEKGEIVGIIAIVHDITERKLAEAVLRDNEERFRALSTATFEGLMIHEDLVVLDANDKFIELFGLNSREDLIGKNWETVLRLAPESMEIIHRRRQRGEHSPFEATMIRGDGEERIIEVQSSDFPYKGRVARAVAVRDITERKLADMLFLESEARYRVLFESTRDAIMTLAPPTWKFMNGNPATLTLFDVKDEVEFASLGPWELSPEKQPDGRFSDEKARDMIETAMREGSHFFEWTHKKYNGEDFPATVLLTRVELGGKVMLQATVRDISEQKRAEEALKESEEQFRLAFESSKDAIIWADADTGILINCNKSAEALLGRPRSEIIGMHQRFAHPESRFAEYEEMFRNHVGRYGAKDVEAEVITKSGETVPVHISSTVVSIAGRTINQGVFRDITNIKKSAAEREALLRRLHQSQKMEAIGQLAGGMAHDFNNIIAVILGTVNQLERELPVANKSRKHLERITKVASRAKDLTMNLLTFARKDKLDVRSIRIDELVEELVDLLKRSLSKKIRIESRCSGCAGLVSLDVNQMTQALLNVCINAADAMPEGGELTIDCEAETEFGAGEREKPPGIAPGRYFRIAITDTGTGMTEDVKERMFNPFFTTKERGKGTGLGLPITIGIVKSHGGAISIDSEPGKGTRVEIYLPVQEGRAEIQEETEREEILPAGKGTVLIIDDDYDFLDMATEILKDNGLSAISALGPLKALELFKEREADVDLVVLDMMMPEMGGEEVFRALKKIDPYVKVLLCSGYSSEGKAKQALDEGAVGFLQKPFDSDQLVRVVSGLLRGD